MNSRFRAADGRPEAALVAGGGVGSRLGRLTTRPAGGPRRPRVILTSRRLLGLGVLLLLLYLIVGGSDITQAACYLSMTLSAPLAIMVGIRRHRPADSRPWKLIALSSFLWAAGECVWYFEHLVINVREPFGYPDALYLSSLAVLFVGLRRMEKSRDGRMRTEPLLDAAIVACAGATLLWYFSVSTALGHRGLSTPLRLLIVAYPLADLLLLTMAAHLAFARGGRTWSGQLLLLGTLSLLFADLSFAIVRQQGRSQPGWVNVGWVMWFALFGAAALHPSMAQALEPAAQPPPPSGRLHHTMIWLAVLLGPCMVLASGFAGRTRRTIGVELLSLVIVVLVLAQVRIISADRERHRERVRSDARFRALVQHATDAVCIVDRSHRLVYASPALNAITGLAGGGEGTIVDDLVVEDDLPALQSLLAAARSGTRPQPSRGELRFTRPDGRSCLTEVTAVDHGDEGGVNGVVLNIRDIDDRLESRRAVRRSEEQLRAATSHAPIVLLACDADGTCTLSEGSALGSLGLQPGQLVGRPLHKAPASCQPIVRVLTPLLSDALATISVDVVLEGRTFQLNASSMSFEDGRGGLLAVACDVTDRVLREQRARTTARRQRASAELWATILHSTFDRERLINEVLTKTSSVLGATCTVVIPGPDGGTWTRVAGASPVPFDETTRAVLGTETVPETPCILTPEGLVALEERRSSRSVSFPIRTHGASVGLLLAFRDLSQPPFDMEDFGFLLNISERTALALDNSRLLGEAQRELAERRHSEQILRASEQRWRAFGTEASHQLRTPLTGLRLRLENELASLGAGQTVGERRAVLLALLGHAENLEETVNDFLALVPSRLHSTEPLDVVMLVDEAEANWRPRIEGAGRDFVVRVENDLPLALVSAPAVRQVLGVLLENALRHGAGRVTLTAREMGGGVVMAVSDEGAGFGAGQPWPRPGTRQNIGLRLARSLADAEGARVQVSRPGPGPTVTFSVPGWAADVEAVTAIGPPRQP